MELKNKVVVITGGTKGLGKSMASLFLKNEAKVIVCSRSDDELKDINNEGILGIKADVTKEEDLDNLMKITKEKFGEVNIWINNAGIWMPHMPIEDIDWNRAHDLIEVNLFGTVYGSKTALRAMRKQGSGIIMNIISTSGLDGKINETAYCASKFAARGFTDSLREEVDGDKIKVLSVYPGGMKTNLFDERIPEKYNDFMDPNDVANTIIENLKKNKPEEKLIIKRN
jgi:short-subunit dehydrogenase